MTLPTELEKQLQTELAQFEEREKMQYVTTIERMAIQKGMQRGLRESILDILQIRFNETSELAETILEQIEDTEQLHELNRQAVTINSLAAFEQLLNETL
jgi:hypothetical protein